MVDIFQYGKVLRSYKALGILQLNNGALFRCSFNAASFVDGTIRVECDFKQSTPPELISLHSLLVEKITVRSINGKTEDDQEIKIEHNLLWTNINFKTDDNSQYSLIVNFIAGEMTVNHAEDFRLHKTVRFGLTNFEFEGNVFKEQKIGTSESWERSILAISLDFGEIIIDKIPDHKATIGNIEANNGIDLTCELVINLQENCDIKWAIMMADSICMLLSLARGTKINWIYLDGFDDQGSKVHTQHRHSITAPFAGSSAAIITYFPPEDLIELIGKGMLQYQSLNTEYDFKGIVDRYLEAKRPHSYLESKALAAIQAMELLAGKYAANHGLVFIVDADDFDNHVANIGDGIRTLFEKEFNNSCAVAMCGKHGEKLRTLNRRTLKQVLRELFGSFKIEVDRNALQAIIDTRNAIVHEGSFRTTDTLQEYHRLISVMDRTLLGMLGYDGYILDWANNWKRVKFQ